MFLKSIKDDHADGYRSGSGLIRSFLGDLEIPSQKNRTFIAIWRSWFSYEFPLSVTTVCLFFFVIGRVLTRLDKKIRIIQALSSVISGASLAHTHAASTFFHLTATAHWTLRRAVFRRSAFWKFPCGYRHIGFLSVFYVPNSKCVTALACAVTRPRRMGARGGGRLTFEFLVIRELRGQ